MIRLSLYLLGLLFTLHAHALQISGTAPSYAGQDIHLSVYNDLFTLTKHKVGQTTIAEDGSFSISFKPEEVRMVSLRIGEHRSNFYVVPGSDYELSLEAWYAQSDAPLSPDKYLPASLIRQDEDSLNLRVSQINFFLEDFQSKNYIQFVRSNPKFAVAQMEGEALEEFEDLTHPFLKDYLSYKIARQQYNARNADDTLYNQYLADGNIRYQNTAYIEFYESFYNKWFNRYQLNGESERIKRYIETTHQIDSLVSLIENHDYVANTESAELITLMELFRLSKSREGYKTPSLIRMIGQLEGRTQSKEIREMARYYLRKLKRLAPGNVAPAFSLKGQDGQAYQLSDFKGKYVYLDFWATWCAPCLRAMPALQEIHARYGDSLVVISISVDEREKKFDDFMARHPYPWLFLYAGAKHPIKAEYEVVAMPTYCLIDPDGNILQHPALSPSHGVKNYFEQLFGTPKHKKPELWDWNQTPKKTTDK